MMWLDPGFDAPPGKIIRPHILRQWLYLSYLDILDFASPWNAGVVADSDKALFLQQVVLIL
jgi:hypothetical protein